jgi:hypothetical protein
VIALVGVAILPVALLAWWLRTSQPRALGQLRWLEVGFFLSFSFFFALLMASDFPSIAPLIDKAPLDLGLSQAAWMS